MAFTIQHVNSDRPVHWSWPLRIAVPDTVFGEALQRAYWAAEFCSIDEVNAFENKSQAPNILFLHDPNTDLQKLNNTPDVVLMLVESVYLNDPLQAASIAEAIQSRLRPHGVFIFSINSSLENWFNEFLIQLSHNQSLPEALQLTASSGYFFYDQRLEAETTLTQVFSQLKETLQSAGTQNDFTFPETSPLYGLALSEDAKRLLAPGNNGFRFDHEHSDAMRISRLTRSINRFKETLHKSRNAVAAAPREVMLESPSPETKSDAEHPESTRKLQAIINDTAGDPEPCTTFLKPHHSYSLAVYIGHATKGSISADSAFADDEVFKDSTAEKETLQILFKSCNEDQPQLGEIELPRSGNSDPATFHFNTTSDPYFEGAIYAYHKNRLIQQALLKAPVKESTTASPGAQITLQVVFCVRQQLNNLEQRTSFNTSLFLDSANNNTGTLLALSDSKPLDLYYNQGLEAIIKDIKAYIEDAVVDIDSYPEDLTHPNNQLLLLKLALKGNALYVNHLKKNQDLKGPLQIVTKREEYVPLDFVYTLPPPGPKATLCDHAREALQEGACKACYDKTLSPAPHICPFGFWCFSEVIERHSIGKGTNGTADYCLSAEPAGPRQTLPILQNTIYASSARVEPEEASNVRELVREAISKNTLQVHEAQDWANWSVLTRTYDPDTLILVVHIEKEITLNVDQLEIGDKDFLVQNYLDASKIKAPASLKAPFMIVIGCETANLKTYGFDISTQLMNEGAAIVISNFTKIRGRQAGPIVIKLVEYLKQNAGSEVMLGQVVLKLRQYLLSEGIMVGLALLAQGDADWKIKS